MRLGRQVKIENDPDLAPVRLRTDNFKHLEDEHRNALQSWWRQHLRPVANSSQMPAILREARDVFREVAAEGGASKDGEVSAPPKFTKFTWLKGHRKMHRELDRLGVFRKLLLRAPPEGDGAYAPVSAAFDQAQPRVLKQIKHTVFPDDEKLQCASATTIRFLFSCTARQKLHIL